MGDIIELTTWPRHQNVFYKITSSAVAFEVKGAECAAIGLAKSPGSHCEYWIVLAQNDQVWIKRQDERGRMVISPNIIQADEFKKFWMTLHGDNIRLGRNGESEAIITYKHKLPELVYITFTGKNLLHPIYWKVELPPQKRNHIPKQLSGGEPQWIPADVQIPDNAIIGGYENESLYIIRASHRGSLTPGKFVASEGLGYISWGGRSNETTNFDVLCGYNYIWVQACNDRIPVGAVVGGYSEDKHETLYVGRVWHNGHLIPGKVQPSHSICYVPYKEREVGKKHYEILVDMQKNVKCAHTHHFSQEDIEDVSESDQEEESYEDNYIHDADENGEILFL